MCKKKAHHELNLTLLLTFFVKDRTIFNFKFVLGTIVVRQHG